MYFNDVHILYYVLFILVGGFIGQFIDYISKCFIKERKIFTKESFSKYKKTMLPNYILILGIAVAYAGLLYKFGLHAGFIENLDLIKYVILIPMLACAFYVDLKEQIIPNRLNLLMFEIGLVFVFIYGFININISLNLLLLIGAIASIVFMIIKRKGTDTYIPFGPFIVLASVITIFVSFSTLFTILMKIFSLGMY